MAYLSDLDHLAGDADDRAEEWTGEWREGIEENSASASVVLVFLFSAIVAMGGLALYLNPQVHAARTLAPTAFAQR